MVDNCNAVCVCETVYLQACDIERVANVATVCYVSLYTSTAGGMVTAICLYKDKGDADTGTGCYI